MSDSVRPHRRQPTRLPHPWDSPSKNTSGVAISFSNAWKWKVKVKSCPTLSDPMDCSLPGSSVHRIFQARTLEWVAISFCNAWKWKVKVKSLSRARLFPTPWTAAYQVPLSMGFSRQEYWSGVPIVTVPKYFKDSRFLFCKYTYISFQIHQFSSVQFSRSVMSDSLWPCGLLHLLNLKLYLLNWKIRFRSFKLFKKHV